MIIGFVQPQLPQQQQPSYYVLAFAVGLFWQESLRRLASIFGAKQYTEESGKIKRLD